MASKLLTNVFVYGTLKRDQPNHHWISASMSDSAADANANGTAAFVGCGRTLRKYPLVIGTRYNIPFLLDRPDTGHLVHGEVYAIDEAKLAHLDVLEDYPKFYGRAQQDIELLDDRNADESQRRLIKCWVYTLSDFPDALLAKPMMASYASTAEQPYHESEQEVSSRADLIE